MLSEIVDDETGIGGSPGRLAAEVLDSMNSTSSPIVDALAACRLVAIQWTHSVEIAHDLLA